MSSTQTNFSRVSMPQPQLKDDGTIEYPNRMKIFKEAPEEVIVMPANQSYGEGLFFSISEDTLMEWERNHREELNKHYASIERHDDTYENIYQKMRKGGISRFFLLHTFSHAIMKELEFSCGYPTASLSERLYFSDRMCGVLIYTADGAEGSVHAVLRFPGRQDLRTAFRHGPVFLQCGGPGGRAAGQVLSLSRGHLILPPSPQDESRTVFPGWGPVSAFSSRSVRKAKEDPGEQHP